jgi:hypothetical protein
VQWANSPNFDAVKFQVKVKLVQLDGRGLGHIKDKLELFAINCMRFLDKVIWLGINFTYLQKIMIHENLLQREFPSEKRGAADASLCAKKNTKKKTAAKAN